MPSDTSPAPMEALLIEAAVIISSFRNRNAESGYQLREPPGTDTILARIDKLVHADEKNVIPKSEREGKRPTNLKPRQSRKVSTERGYEIEPAQAPCNTCPTFETTCGLEIPRLAR